MKRFFIFAIMLAVFASAADAKRYIVTVENNSRAKINWNAFVTRSGGDVVKTFDFISGALLELSDEQASRIASRAGNGLTIEEDLVEYWLEDGWTPAGKTLSRIAAGTGIASPAPVPNDSVPAVKPGTPAASTVTEWEDYMQGKEFPWGISRISAASAWPRAEGAGIKVGIIDSGINYDHEDLKDNYAGGINYSNEGDEDDPMDGHGHGTHVAGIIAAARNGKGVVGVAPKARIYSIKTLDSDGHGSRSAVIAGIEWAVENKMQVINMSLGSPSPTEAQHKAIQAATAAGIIVVCSAGNRGPNGVMSYPGRFPETIAVAASDRKDNVASFSSRGSEVDVIAPGVNVISTMMDGTYNRKSGTSMACPHVSGLAALALSAGYKPSQVRNMIQNNVIRLNNLSDEEQGRGLANALWLKK